MNIINMEKAKGTINGGKSPRSYRAEQAERYLNEHPFPVHGRGVRSVAYFKAFHNAMEYTKGADYAVIVPVTESGYLWRWTTNDPITGIWIEATRKAGRLQGYVVDRYDPK